MTGRTTTSSIRRRCCRARSAESTSPRAARAWRSTSCPIPTPAYFTPLSRGIAASLSLSAEHGDGDFMDYYYSVTPAQSAVSGLPAFDAEGGWTKAGGNLLLGFDLDGNLENGGLALVVVGGY